MVDVPNSVATTPAVAASDPVAQAPAVNGDALVSTPVAINAPSPVVVDNSVTNVAAAAPAPEASAANTDALAAAPSGDASVNPVTVNNTVITPPAPEAPVLTAPEAAIPAPAVEVNGDINTRLTEIEKTLTKIDAKITNNTALASPSVEVNCGDNSIVSNKSPQALSAAETGGFAQGA